MSINTQHSPPLTAVVLAGGLGTRIHSLYPNLPKPMIPVHGKPFVEWVLRYLRAQGIERAILSSGYLAGVIEKHFASQPVKGMEVQCVAEPFPLGTAGGFLHAVARASPSPPLEIPTAKAVQCANEPRRSSPSPPREERAGERRPFSATSPEVHGKSPPPTLDAHCDHEPSGVSPSPPLEERVGERRPAIRNQAVGEGSLWLVLNGDSLVLADLNPAAELLKNPEVEAVVLGIEVPDTSRYGKLRFSCTGQLLHFAEKEPGKGVINAGVYLFRDSVLSKFPPHDMTRPLSFEKDVFPALLNHQTHIQVCIASGPFLDIGTPASVAQADAFIQQNLNAFQV